MEIKEMLTTKKWNGRFGNKADAIVLHKTLGRRAGDLPTLIDANTRQASAHYWVGRSGEVIRIVREEDTSWHAGNIYQPNARGASILHTLRGAYVNPNVHTVGIEMEGLQDQTYTEAQVSAVTELVRQIQARHNIPNERIVTHQDITSYKQENAEGYYQEVARRLKTTDMIKNTTNKIPVLFERKEQAKDAAQVTKAIQHAREYFPNDVVFLDKPGPYAIFIRVTSGPTASGFMQVPGDGPTIRRHHGGLVAGSSKISIPGGGYLNAGKIDDILIHEINHALMDELIGSAIHGDVQNGFAYKREDGSVAGHLPREEEKVAEKIFDNAFNPAKHFINLYVPEGTQNNMPDIIARFLVVPGTSDQFLELGGNVRRVTEGDSKAEILDLLSALMIDPNPKPTTPEYLATLAKGEEIKDYPSRELHDMVKGMLPRLEDIYGKNIG